MSEIHQLLEELDHVSGLNGAAVITQDGITVASVMKKFDDDVVAGLSSFLVSTTDRAIGTDGPGFDRFVLHATHGRLVVENLDNAYLVVVTDQFVDLDPLLVEIDDVARRLRRAVKIQTTA